MQPVLGFFTLHEFRGRIDDPRSTFLGRLLCKIAPKACGSRDYDEEEVRANKLFELDKQTNETLRVFYQVTNYQAGTSMKNLVAKAT